MTDRQPDLVFSGLSRMFSRDGVTVEVSIYRLGDRPTEWSLEVVNSSGTSIVWDDTFTSDDDAFTEFMATVEEEGMNAFREGGSNVVPFPTKH